MARIDCSKLVTPTRDRVKAACKDFNKAYAISEKTLEELFNKYRGNDDIHHVFLKVVALNFLYSTRIVLHSTKIRDVSDVAEHIYKNHKEIDCALDHDPPKIETIVDAIASVPVSGKKTRGCFSFATKYCSWHKPKSYAIWDSNVKVYLRCLQTTGFRADFKVDGDWKYPMFHGVMADLVKCYDLGELTLKDIDKFLWMEGERLKNSGDGGVLDSNYRPGGGDRSGNRQPATGGVPSHCSVVLRTRAEPMGGTTGYRLRLWQA